jgi:hypothetical protein
MVLKLFDGLVYVFSGEWLLRNSANSGGIVVARSLITAVVIYALACSLKAILTTGATLAFDATALRALIHDTLPWLGAIFAGVYASLYTRFAAQWTYLANLYNQLMASGAQMLAAKLTSEQKELYGKWKVGFIEDAEDLHLALKPMYAAVIASMLAEEGIEERYLKDVPKGDQRLPKLKSAIARVLGRPEVALQRAGTAGAAPSRHA